MKLYDSIRDITIYLDYTDRRVWLTPRLLSMRAMSEEWLALSVQFESGIGLSAVRQNIVRWVLSSSVHTVRHRRAEPPTVHRQRSQGEHFDNLCLPMMDSAKGK